MVWPKLKPVLKAYPDISVELLLDSTFRNIVEEGFDTGVRLGESAEKDMIAVRIGPDWRLVAVASPGYLDAHGVPRHPQDLIRHVCISMRQETEPPSEPSSVQGHRRGVAAPKLTGFVLESIFRTWFHNRSLIGR